MAVPERRAQRPPSALVRALDAERDRWFLWWPVAFGLGAAILLLLPDEPPLSIALLALPAAFATAFLAPRTTLWAAFEGFVIAMALGFVDARLRIELVRAPVLAKHLSNVEVRGFVELIEPNTKRGERITLRVSRIDKVAPEATPTRVRVRVLVPSKGLGPGDPVILRATLSPPGLPAVRGDFDFARTAWFRGLGATGYAIQPPRTDPEPPPEPLMLAYTRTLQRLRLAISQRLGEALPGQPGAVAAAIMVGERSAISEATNESYRRAGMTHILVIAGLHMSALAGAAFFLVRFVLAGIPFIALRFPIKKWAALAAEAAAVVYLLLSGSVFSTQRAFLMLSVGFLAVLIDRRALALRNLAVAAIVILAIYPESVLDVSFQMSFACVATLISGFEALRDLDARRTGRRARYLILERLETVGGLLISSALATLGVMPLVAYHFHELQPYGVIGNLIALPLCELVVVPLALASVVAMPLGLEAAPLWLMGHAIDAMGAWAAFVAGLPGAMMRVRAMPEAAIVLIVTGGLWLVLWRRRWRLVGLLPVALGLALTPFGERADLLVGHDGRLVAARGADGRLGAVASKGAEFELGRWLERDGDARAPDQLALGEMFRCDPLGCVARIKGRVIAVARSPDALADDCARADVLILAFARPARCDSPAVVIDSADVRAKGTHEIFLTSVAGDGTGPARQDRSGIRVEKAASARGHHSWTIPAGSASSAVSDVRPSLRRLTFQRAAPPLADEGGGEVLDPTGGGDAP